MWSFIGRSITMRCLTLPQSLPVSLLSINKTHVFRSVSLYFSSLLISLFSLKIPLRLLTIFIPRILVLDLGLLLSILEVHSWFLLFDVWCVHANGG